MANSQYLEILKHGSEIWNQWRRENPNLDLSFSHEILNHADLRSANLVLVKLKDTSLRFSNLIGANLNHADLTGSDLSNANLTGALLWGAGLSNTNISAAILIDAHLVRANLTHANLVESQLLRANLSQANLSQANLSETDLSCGNLSNAFLRNAKFSRAKLTNAILVQADLTGADFSNADLTGANLSNSNLEQVNFNSAILDQTNFSDAQISNTLFLNNDLSAAKGLDTVRHASSSRIGIDTIYRSGGNISETFLHNSGIPSDFVTYLASLNFRIIQFYSCFISHAHSDNEFADRLYQDLVSNNVSCWYDRENMLGGRYWRAQISQAIKVHEKLILICSKESLQRPNVIEEIIAAIQHERDTRSQKLFPVRLDDFILSPEMLKMTSEKLESGEWREDWVAHVKSFHISDFQSWKDANTYTSEFRKLLEALRNPDKR